MTHDCTFSSSFGLFSKACTDASRFKFACFYLRFTIYWFLLLGNSAFGNGLDGSLAWIVVMYCILSCLLVLRQLDRRYSIASQTSLPLKVTGTINEHTSTIIFCHLASHSQSLTTQLLAQRNT